MDRFGDDLCEVLLSYLNVNEKYRLDCISKQWKRCIHQKENYIKFGSYNGLNISLLDLIIYPKILEKFKKIYRNVQIVEFATNFFIKSPIFELFPHLKEIVINFQTSPTNKELYNLLRTIPENIKIRIKNVVCIQNSAQFEIFASYFVNRVTELRLHFHQIPIDDCIDVLCKFKLLEKLKILDTIEDKHFAKLSTLSELKNIFVYIIESNSLSAITEIMKKFNSLTQFSAVFQYKFFIFRIINDKISY